MIHMIQESEHSISAGHPALAGHFPGHPVVPGVLLLDEIHQAACRWLGGFRLTGISTAKFAAPLLPGVTFTIRLEGNKHEGISFTCLQSGRTIARGRMLAEADGEA